ncbi:MAG: hypothetical protein GX995_07135 [Clostridiales bacterium]|nr:hypothetical protein [Clostridiales bacterium]
MKNVINKFNNLNQGTKIKITTVLTIVAILISVSLISFFAHKFSKISASKDSANDDQEVVASDISGEDTDSNYNEDNQVKAPSLEDENEEDNEDDDQVSTSPSDETESSSQAQEGDSSDDLKTNESKVEKAPVNDEGDPQSNSSSGVSMDISNIRKEDKGSSKLTYGIDVSKWQGVIDWKKVKDSGVEFAMIRAGYRTLDKGIIQEDPYAQYNLQQAQANGIKIGVYFFSTAINEDEVKEEAKWLTDFIAPYRITYPVAFNCEGFTNPSNRQYSLSKEDRTNLAINFLDYVSSKGYTPMFYAAKSEIEGNSQWNASKLASKYKIWVAQYPESFSPSSKSSYSGSHHMWQYTSKGQVAGISKTVDLNVAYFGYDTEAKAKSDTPVETVTADPTALIDFRQVDEDVTAKESTNLRNLPSTEGSSIVAELKNGDIARRIGIGSNGWSKLIYNDKTLYAKSDLLTTDLSPKSETPNSNIVNGQYFSNVNEDVTAKEVVNLRTVPSSESNDTIKGQLKNGQVARRTGVGDKGWSRLEIDGVTYYVITSYITTDLSHKAKNSSGQNKEEGEVKEPTKPSPEKPSLDKPEAGMNFVSVNEKVTAKELTNLRLIPSQASDDLVAGQLKNGEIAIRTGIDKDKGWSRLVYSDKTLYAVTSYLENVE